MEILAHLTRSKLIIGSRAGQSAFVGSNADADSRAAYQDPSIFRFDEFRHLQREVRVMAGRLVACSDVQHIVFEADQVVLDGCFESEASVVRTDQYFIHIISSSFSMESVMQGSLVSDSWTVALPELSAFADCSLKLHSHVYFSRIVEEDGDFFRVYSIGDDFGIWIFGSAPWRGSVRQDFLNERRIASVKRIEERCLARLAGTI